MSIIKEIEIENSYKGVVEKLKKARQDKGMSQYELAKSAGLTQATVTAIEKKTKRATLMTIIRMSKALGEVIML